MIVFSVKFYRITILILIHTVAMLCLYYILYIFMALRKWQILSCSCVWWTALLLNCWVILLYAVLVHQFNKKINKLNVVNCSSRVLPNGFWISTSSYLISTFLVLKTVSLYFIFIETVHKNTVSEKYGIFGPMCRIVQYLQAGLKIKILND